MYWNSLYHSSKTQYAEIKETRQVKFRSLYKKNLPTSSAWEDTKEKKTQIPQQLYNKI